MKYFSAIVFALLVASNLSCTKKQDLSTTLHGVLKTKVKTFDPIHTSDTLSNRVATQVYEALYNYHYLKRPLVLQPLLAESMPEISDDGKTYTIKIKKGVKFADDPAFPSGNGREITAKDFVYSWKRLADPANKSQGFWIFDNRIEGLNQWRKNMKTGKANYNTPISGLQTPDDHTLVIKLIRPLYQFPHLLSLTFTAVVPREAVELYGQDFASKPVGTGPYKLEQWIRGSVVKFIRNDNYHEVLYPTEGDPGDKEAGLLEDAGKPLPFADKLEIRIMVERQPMWLNFITGELDHTYVPKDNFSEAFADGQMQEKWKKKGMKVAIYSHLDVVYYGFNMEHPLFANNKKLRQAIARGYNTQEMLDKFYNGRGVIANGPIPPEVDGYDTNYKGPLSYDKEAAKKLLAEAGYPEGKGLQTIEIDLPSPNTVARQMGEFFKNQMAEIGIKVKLIPNSWPQFDKKVKTKKSMFFTQAWIADYPDGENFLQMFYSKNVSPGSNATNFKDPKFDALYEKSLSLPPGPERTKIYQELNRYLVEAAPAHFRIHRLTYRPYQGWIKNFKRNSIMHDFYKYLRVDKKLKAKLKPKM